jgi:hypothetical protein
LFLCCFYLSDAVEGIQRAWIADEGEVRGDDSDKEVLVVAIMVITVDMSL